MTDHLHAVRIKTRTELEAMFKMGNPAVYGWIISELVKRAGGKVVLDMEGHFRGAIRVGLSGSRVTLWYEPPVNSRIT